MTDYNELIKLFDKIKKLEKEKAELLKIVLEFAGFMNEADRNYILKKYK